MDPLVNLPDDSSPIVDPDEEIFLLYTTLNQAKTDLVGPDGYRGLGHVDSRKDTLTIQFELRSPNALPSNLPASSSTQQSKSTKKAKHSRNKVSEDSATKVIEIEIAQDPTALRSRNGDTGSVVWRASIALANAILQQHFFPQSPAPLFNRDSLAECSCLELGSGTGLLGLALAPFVREYTITDMDSLLPLIRKNVSMNVPASGGPDNSGSNITVEELDWITLSSLPPGPTRGRYCPAPKSQSKSRRPSDLDVTVDTACAWDLILAVDCIYNPSLLPALVETIDAVSEPGRTWVLVVAELRQEDVLREFLELWMRVAGGRWRIMRVDGLLDVHYVVWAGQKREVLG